MNLEVFYSGWWEQTPFLSVSEHLVLLPQILSVGSVLRLESCPLVRVLIRYSVEHVSATTGRFLEFSLCAVLSSLVSDLWTLAFLVFLCSQLPFLNSGNTPGFPWLSLPGLWSGNSPKSVSWGNLSVLVPSLSDHWSLFPDIQWHKGYYFTYIVQVFVASCGKVNLISVLWQLKCLCLNS